MTGAAVSTSRAMTTYETMPATPIQTPKKSAGSSRQAVEVSTSRAMTTVVDLEEEETMPLTHLSLDQLSDRQVAISRLLL